MGRGPERGAAPGRRFSGSRIGFDPLAPIRVAAALLMTCMALWFAPAVGSGNTAISTLGLFSHNLIRSSDPSLCTVAAATPNQGAKDMYPGGSRESQTAWLFTASCDTGSNSFEIHVGAGFATQQQAMAEAKRFGEAIGRLPKVLRDGLRVIKVHATSIGAWRARPSEGLILAYAADLRITAVGSSPIEELLVHEASHVALDPRYRASAGWLAAQRADGDFISGYAAQNPGREDLAESFLAYLAARFRPARILQSTERRVFEVMPNRVAFFDSVLSAADMQPFAMASPRMAGLVVYDTSLNVNAGSDVAYDIRLMSPPGSNVTVTPASGDSSKVTVSGPVTFTPGNWHIPQRLTVTGVGEGMATVSHAIASSDSNYNGLMNLPPVSVMVKAEGALAAINLSVEEASATVTEGGTAKIFISREGSALTEGLTLTLPPLAASGRGVTVDDFKATGSVSWVGDPLPQIQAIYDARSNLHDFELVDDEEDEPVETMTVGFAGRDFPDGTQPGSTVALTVIDNDPTRVILSGTGDVIEGRTKPLTLALGRALVAGEVLPVPLTFGGAASRGGDYTLACDAATNVTCSGLDSGSATVTFTGPSAKAVTLTLTAAADNADEGTGETVQIGLGTLDDNSGTGLDGGAIGIDRLPEFRILETSAKPTVALSVDREAANEGQTVIVTATLSGTIGQDVTVPLTASDVDADESDYTLLANSITIPAGEVEGTVQLALADDAVDEPPETLTLTLGALPSAVERGTAASSKTDIRILDNDPTTVTLSGSFADINEGDTKDITISLGRALVDGEMLTASLTKQNSGGAKFGSNKDFTLACESPAPTGIACPASIDKFSNSQPLKITFEGPSDRSVTLTLTALTDSDNSADPLDLGLGPLDRHSGAGLGGGARDVDRLEEFDIQEAGTAASKTAALSIRLSDPLRGSGKDRAWLTEGEMATLIITLSTAHDADVAFTFISTSSGGSNDVSGSDYTINPASVTIQAGNTEGSTVLSATDDSDVEGSELGTLNLVAPNPYTIKSDRGSVDYVILDNDFTALPEIEISPWLPVTEGSRAGFTVSADRAVEADLTVHLSVADAEGSDFVASGNEGAKSVTIQKDKKSAVFTVDTEADGVDEPDGEITVTVSADTGDPAAYTVATASSATVEVEDDDEAGNAVNLSVGSGGAIAEGGSALTITATLARANATGGALSIPVEVRATGTTAQPGDYTLGGAISIADGATTGTTSFAVTEDADDEPVETAVVELGSSLPDGVTKGSTDHVTVTISDNDPTTVTLSAARPAITESGSGNRTDVTVALGRELVAGESVTVPLTVTGAAVATHYTLGLKSGATLNTGVSLLTVSPHSQQDPAVVLAGAGARTATLELVAADNNDMTARTVSLAWGVDARAPAPSQGSTGLGGGIELAGSPATVAIADDDSGDPEVSIARKSAAVLAEGETVTFTVSLGHVRATALDVTVSVTQDGDFAASGQAVQRSVTVPAGALSAELTVATQNDMVDEADGSITATVEAGTGYTVSSSAGSATAKVNDNDGGPTVSIAAPSSAGVVEGGAGVLNFMVSANPPPATALTVNVALASEGAAAGASGAATVTVPTSGSAPYAVTVTDDSDDEPDGAVTAVISTGSGYRVARAPGHGARVTVADDDPTLVTLARAAGTVTEGGTKTLTLTLGRGLVKGETLTVPLTFGGTATRGSDYTMNGSPAAGVAYNNLNDGSATVAFEGPETGSTAAMATIVLTAAADGMAESTPETVAIGLGALTHTGLGGGAVGTDDLAEFSIEDQPTDGVTISPTSFALTELGAADAVEKTWMVVLDTDPGADVTVTATVPAANRSHVQVKAGGASFANMATLTFTEGGDGSGTGVGNGNWAVEQTVTVKALNDADAVNVPSFNIAHTAIAARNTAPYHGIAIDPVAVTVTDAGNGVSVSETMLSVRDSDETATYKVVLKSEPSGNVTITATSSVAARAEVDTNAGMAGNQSTLVFTSTDWLTPQTVTVTGKGAGGATINHAVSATADPTSYPTGLSIPSVSVTVTADARPAVDLSIDDSGVREGASTDVTVTLTGGRLATDVSIPVAVTGADAADYSFAGSVAIVAGASSGSAVLSITDDAADEPNEELALAFGALPEEVQAGTVTSVGVVIIDGDATEVTLARKADETGAIAEKGGTAEFTVTLGRSLIAGETVTAPLALSGSGITAGDYTVRLKAGETLNGGVTLLTADPHSAAAPAVRFAGTGADVSTSSVGAATLELVADDDNLDEGASETVTLALGAVTASLDRASGTGGEGVTGTGTFDVAITDDDGMPTALTLTVDADTGTQNTQTSLAEGGGAKTVRVTATLSGSSTFTEDKTVSVEVGKADDSATEGADYAEVATKEITIAAGSSSGHVDFTLTPTDDDIDEGASESIGVEGTLTGVAITGASIGITDDDTRGVTVSAPPAGLTVLEADNPATNTTREDQATYTVALTSEPTASVTVNVAVPDGAPFTVSPASLTFTPSGNGIWSTAQVVTVTAVDDSIDNTGGERSAVISHEVDADGTDYEDETASGVTVTVTDDDAAPTALTLTVDADTETDNVQTSVSEGGGAKTVRVTATLDGSTTFATDKTVTVEVGKSSDGAAEGTDYAMVATQTITLKAGASSGYKDFTLTPTDDAVDEANETISLDGTLAGVTVADAEITLTDDDDAPGGIALSVDTDSVTADSQTEVGEAAGATTVTVTATVTGSTTYSGAQTVVVNVSGGTATVTDDFAPVTGFSITIPAGTASARGTFTLTPVADAIDENDETVDVTGAVSGDGAPSVTGATITIKDDDEKGVTVSAASAGLTIRETDDAGTSGMTENVGTYTVVLTSEPTDDVVIDVSVPAGAPFTVNPTSLTFTPSGNGIWSTEQTVTVTAVNDSIDNVGGERTAEISHTLTAGSSDYQGVSVPGVDVTVTDDDGAPGGIALSVDTDSNEDGNQTEVGEAAGATTVAVTATVTGGTTYSGAQTVAVSVSGNTATVTDDFAPVPGFNITIPAGTASARGTFTLTPVADAIDEKDETVDVTGAVSGDGAPAVTGAAITIKDDDEKGVTVSAASGGLTVLEADNPATNTTREDQATYTVVLTSEPTANVIVNVTVPEGAPFTVSPTSLTFTPSGNGIWSTAQVVTVTALDDSIDNAGGGRSASITHSLTAGTSDYGGVTADGVSVTVSDDDAPPTGITLTTDTPTIAENAATKTVKVTATVNGTTTYATDKTVGVTVGDKDDSATSGDDYAAVAAFDIIIAAGKMSGEKTFSLDPTDDALDEVEESISVKGASGTLTITGASIKLTDDDVPELSITAGSAVDEGTAAAFTVNASPVPAEDLAVNVDVTTSAGFAVTNTTGDQSFTFSAGGASQTYTVATRPDTTDEADGQVEVTLEDGDDYTVHASNNAASVAVNDDDPTTVTLARAGSGGIAEDGGAEDITITLGRELVAGESVTVPLEVSGATAATHYTIGLKGNGGAGVTIDTGNPHSAGNPAVILAGAGAQVATLTLTAVDTSDTDRRTVTIAFGTNNRAPSHTGLSGGIDTTGSAAIAIIDDDATIAVAAASAAEGSAVVFNVTLPEAAPAGGVTIDYSTTDGRGNGNDESYQVATSADYVAAAKNASITIAQGDRTGAISIDTTDDGTYEGDHHFTLTLDNTNHFNIDSEANSATGTITDAADTPSFEFSATSSTVAENVGTLSLTVGKTGATLVPATVTYKTTDGTAAGGSDFTAIAATDLTFAANEASKTVTVTVIDDSNDESSEAFSVDLAAKSHAGLGGDASHAVTVTDNDPTPVTLSATGTAIAEDGGVKTITVTLGRALTGSETLSAPLTFGGDATFGTDYTLAGPETAPTGVTFSNLASTDLAKNPPTVAFFGVEGAARRATLTLTASDDAIDEGASESVELGLGTLTAANLDGGASRSGAPGFTITDDDAAPSGITLTTDTPTIAEDAATKMVTVTATVNNGGAYTTDTTVAVEVGASGDSASEGVDYADVAGFDITITAGAMSAQGSFSLDPTDDSLDEDDETISVKGTSGGLGITGASIGLTDNDNAPVLSIDAPSVAEGASGSGATLRFTVTLTPASGKEVTVAWAEAAGGTATPGTDYTALTGGTLTFAAGDTTRHIDIAVTGDDIDEESETVRVRLSSPSNATLAGGNASLDGTGTIGNDDQAGVTVTGNALGGGALIVGKEEETVIRVSLASEPVADVTVRLTSEQPSIADLSASPRGPSVDLTFTPTNWSMPQAVTVHGKEDGMVVITTTVTSTDPQYRKADVALPRLETRVAAIPSIIITADAAMIREGEPARFTLTADRAPAADLPVRINVGYGCCLGNGRVLAEGQEGARTVIVPQNETTVPFEVETVDDDVRQLNEILEAKVLPGAGYRPGGGNRAFVRVSDNDPLPDPGIRVSIAAPASVMEGGALPFTLTASKAPERDLPVSLNLYAHSIFAYVPGPAVRTVRHDPEEERREIEVILPAGQTGKMFEVTLPDDNARQGHGTMVAYVSFSPDNGYRRADHPDNRAEIALIDDETRAGESAISVADAEVREGPGAALEFVATLARRPGANGQVRAFWRLRDGTATAGEDYQDIAGMVRFQPGETEFRVHIQVFEDAKDEGDETLVFELYNATPGGWIERGEAVGTIRDALSASASAADQAQQAETGPQATACIPASVLADVGDYVEEVQHGGAHVARWQRVLDAFAGTPGGMTAAGAREMAAQYSASRWDPVAAALGCMETAASWWGALSVEARVRALFGTGLGAEEQAGRKAAAASRYTSLDPGTRALAAGAAVGLIGAGAHESLAAWWDGLGCGARRVAVGAGNVADAASPWCRAWSALDGTHRPEALRIGRALFGAGLPATLSNDVEEAGLLNVADAQAVEGPGAALSFAVRLTGAPDARTQEVTVAYATRDGTATAGADYEAVAGRLVFAPGETEKTVAVAVHDDGHDEGEETMTLVLSDPEGATLGRAVGVGAIVNTDAMPEAWLARFGRAVAEQLVESVSERFGAPRRAGFEGRFAGQTLGASAPVENDTEAPGGIGVWPEEEEEDGAAGSRTTTMAEMLMQSDFTLTGAGNGSGGSWALWARASERSFDGADGPLSLDGTVTTGLFGMDFAREGWIAGAALTHSKGEGGYMLQGGAGGAVETVLTAFAPYAHVRIDDSLTAWGVLGIGEGRMTLTPESEAGMAADLDWRMAAVGLADALVQTPVGGGFGLSAKMDALWAHTASGAAPGLVAAHAGVTRLRLGLEGSWTVALEGGSGPPGSSLTPKLEVGMRHDGGDAETGFGVELGGGLAWVDPRLGLNLDLSGRTLVAHGDDKLRDRGFTASLAFDPDPASARGLSLSLSQDWGGSATGGLDALFTTDPLGERSGGGEEESRWQVEAAYGFRALGGRFTGSPHVGFGLATGARDYTLGWRLSPAGNALDFSLGLKATRRESNSAPPEHRLGAEVNIRW